jgi:putative endonuclease
VNKKERKGYLGEFIAVCLLKLKGYRILARRYKTVCGEIDIVAQKADSLAFVEVKSRKSVEKCYDAIKIKQLKHMRRASEIFMNRRRDSNRIFPRYDVILVADWRLPIHIENVSVE